MDVTQSQEGAQTTRLASLQPSELEILGTWPLDRSTGKLLSEDQVNALPRETLLRLSREAQVYYSQSIQPPDEPDQAQP